MFSAFRWHGPDDQWLLCRIPRMARAYFNDRREDLLTGETAQDGLALLQARLQEDKLDHDRQQPTVWHFFYEFGQALVGGPGAVGAGALLALELEYADARMVGREHWGTPLEGEWELQEEVPFETYQERFERGYGQLLAGNCYQFNLTFPSCYDFRGHGLSARGLLAALWSDPRRTAPYAHATHIPAWDTLWASNSPECLFESWPVAGGRRVRSLPIKGTVQLAPGESDQEGWSRLKSSKKDQAELYMIADLVRNDLCALGSPRARVVRKKAPLLAPGLVHQYSLVSTLAPEGLSMAGLVGALFPGGSVTGAPKKRTMAILKELEEGERGLYCGSTVLLWGTGAWGSINIRTAKVDMIARSIDYRAGGGVTLLSSAESEWEELRAKRESFMNLLKSSGTTLDKHLKSP